MSGSLQTWHSLRDLEMLGARHAALEGELPLGALPRLTELLHDSQGSVRASLSFQQRGDGWLTLRLGYETTVHLVCQRCLEPISERLAGQIDVAVVEPEAAPAVTVPAGFEPVELDRGRLNPSHLIEDELIVSIPLVPKHARAEDCGSLARALTTADPAA
jgi:uncharacterized protein